jgi:uncharacterized membrane protein YqgA involved in biofilm formation
VTLPLGTLLNIVTVAVGTLFGVMIGDRLPERMRDTAMAVIGLVTLVLGVQMAGATHNILLTLVSVLLGGVLGEALGIDDVLNRLGKRIEALVTRNEVKVLDSAPRSSVATAFVTASLIFCVGPITVVGSIQDGLTGDYQLIAIKSLLDMIASLTLASTLGWGVGLSTLTILVVQGGISTLARLLGENAVGLVADRTVRAGESLLPLGGTMLDEMTAAGGILMLGIALLLLDLKRVRVANMLPAVALAPAIVAVLHWLDVPVAP